MKRLLMRLAGGIFVFALLAGCGGGGGGGSSSQEKVVAVMKMAQLSSYATPIAGIQATLIIPYGLTVKTLANDPSQPDSTVVQLLNAPNATNVQVIATYIPATPTADGTLTFGIIDAQGFTAPEQIIINLNVTSGFYPKSSDFSDASLINTEISDINGVLLNIQPTLTATIQ